MNKSYEDKIHFYGRLTLILGFLCTLLLPLTLKFYFGIFPTKEGLISAIISVCTVMAPIAIIQLISYAPMLGSSALYMAYLTGNLANLKIPSSSVAIEAADVDPNTEEGEVISAIAVTGSVIISEIIIFLGVLLLVPLKPVFNNPVVSTAISQITPALFGALLAQLLLKEWRLAVIPFILNFVIVKFSLIPGALQLPVSIILSMLSARILYKLNFFNHNENRSNNLNK